MFVSGNSGEKCAKQGEHPSVEKLNFVSLQKMVHSRSCFPHRMKQFQAGSEAF
jgi:hypothetical protein